MRIREATEDDLATVTRLRLEFLAAFRGVRASSFPPDFERETESFIRRHQADRTIRSWIAEVDAVPVGIVSMLLLDLPPRPEDVWGREGYIVNMYVAHDHRRRGIGTDLLERCLVTGRELSLRRLFLHATDDGRPRYEAAGFRTSSTWMELPLDP